MDETLIKLRNSLLKSNPLWSDILACHRQGFSKEAIARICGCKLSTLRKHMARIAECGLFHEEVR